MASAYQGTFNSPGSGSIPFEYDATGRNTWRANPDPNANTSVARNAIAQALLNQKPGMGKTEVGQGFVINDPAYGGAPHFYRDYNFVSPPFTSGNDPFDVDYDDLIKGRVTYTNTGWTPPSAEGTNARNAGVPQWDARVGQPGMVNPADANLGVTPGAPATGPGPFQDYFIPNQPRPDNPGYEALVNQTLGTQNPMKPRP
jgi:hypothetical protein